MRQTFVIIIAAVLLCIISAGCAGTRTKPPAKRQYEIISQGSGTLEQLQIPRLTASLISEMTDTSADREAIIMVHPAYSQFFRDKPQDFTSFAKYSMLKQQFENESNSIVREATAGRLMILVLPGNYPADSIAPNAFVKYVNRVTAGGANVFYVLSETSSSGALPLNDIVDLVNFLQAMNVTAVKLGGGYIGRCQREFYNQFTSYMDWTMVYIAPELSTISPDDVNDREARHIAIRARRDDYTPVKAFLDKKTGGKANVLTTPPRKADSAPISAPTNTAI